MFSGETGEFSASHPVGTVEKTRVCQVTSQCPGIHVGPRFPCVCGAVGSLSPETTPSNTRARFMERNVPWKVFGRWATTRWGGGLKTGMIMLETGKESPAAEVRCIRVTMILQELLKKKGIPWTNPANSLDCGNDNFFSFFGILGMSLQHAGRSPTGFPCPEDGRDVSGLPPWVHHCTI